MADPDPLADDALLAAVLRKFINMPDGEYINFGYRHEDAFITIDATLALTDDELAAVVRAETPDA